MISSAKVDVLYAYLSRIMKTKLNCWSSGIPLTQFSAIIAMEAVLLIPGGAVNTIDIVCEHYFSYLIKLSHGLNKVSEQYSSSK